MIENILNEQQLKILITLMLLVVVFFIFELRKGLKVYIYSHDYVKRND